MDFRIWLYSFVWTLISFMGWALIQGLKLTCNSEPFELSLNRCWKVSVKFHVGNCASNFVFISGKMVVKLSIDIPVSQTGTQIQEFVTEEVTWLL